MNNLNKKVIILVIEDEKSLADNLQERMKNVGFETISASDGSEGLKIALNRHPDLILLDLLMPNVDGMSMLKEMRKDYWGKNVPVIILTNLSSSDEKINKDLTNLEPTYYFMKTEIGVDGIIEKIKERLGIIN